MCLCLVSHHQISLELNLLWVKHWWLLSVKLTHTHIFASTTFPSHAIRQPGGGCSSLPKRPGVFQLWFQASCHLRAQATFPSVAKPVARALQQGSLCTNKRILQICVISYLEVRFGGRRAGPGIPHPNTGSAKALPGYLFYFLLLFNVTIDSQIFMVL